jgi:UDP-N-acetylmuramate--alanine ligase
LAVRETNTYNVYSQDLVDRIPNSCCFDTFDQISDYIVENAQPGDLVITLGGGNIYQCTYQIVEKYKAKA